ncbi:MAG: glycosyltransferase family 2 protein [Mojavia pulchra JT2-VF2]|jgi:glycosyltransferase involved in cell wall biosynthesis|uniref:Glycosyltransferase family 2 protein n=1 Tax=Mojavia pulchra JT2-VF2 TaxID=287848 RepID=A0A951PXX3_9NOST|nr:glycosyltransferase family 2 protein [Mojavia pulchra JT2-VF2]
MSLNIDPLVSIIIPTYNYAKYIGDAVESILNSDFNQDDIEIIIIDDGSTDNTAEKVAIYGNRVKYIFQENLGKAWATKVGIDNCRGKYLFNLDADDIFLPNKIQEVVQIFESNPDIVHVGHPALCWNVDKNIKTSEVIPKCILGNKVDGRELLTFFYRRGILFGGGSTFAARVEAIRKFSIPREVDMYIDEYLVMCTLNQGYSYFINSPMSIWRIHGNNFSGVTSNRVVSEAKIRRSFNSMKAILNNLNDFEQEIINIYSLRLKISEVSFKEGIGEKTFIDILSMWLLFLKNFDLWNQEHLRMIQAYTLLNRSLPTSTLNLLRFIKKGVSHSFNI